MLTDNFSPLFDHPCPVHKLTTRLVVLNSDRETISWIWGCGDHYEIRPTSLEIFLMTRRSGRSRYFGISYALYLQHLDLIQANKPGLKDLEKYTFTILSETDVYQLDDANQAALIIIGSIPYSGPDRQTVSDTMVILGELEFEEVVLKGLS